MVRSFLETWGLFSRAFQKYVLFHPSFAFHTSRTCVSNSSPTKQDRITGCCLHTSESIFYFIVFRLFWLASYMTHRAWRGKACHSEAKLQRNCYSLGTLASVAADLHHFGNYIAVLSERRGTFAHYKLRSKRGDLTYAYGNSQCHYSLAYLTSHL